MKPEVTVRPSEGDGPGWNIFIGDRCALHVRPDYVFPTGEQRGWKYYRPAKAKGIPYCRMFVDGEAKAIEDATTYAQRWVGSGLMRDIA